MTPQRPVAAIVYLDVDDEITSAAARIRTTAERHLAIVLPSGSRVSTSRINFRLLAREAAVHGRDLAIVAPEASARALAASAGLPAFSSVAEYEDALADAAEEVEGSDDERGGGGGLDEGGAAGPMGAGDTGDTGDTGDERLPTGDAGASRADAGGRAAPGPGRATARLAGQGSEEPQTGQLTGWWARDTIGTTPRPSRASIGGERSPSGRVPGRTEPAGRAAAPGAYPTPPDVGSSRGGVGVRSRTSVTDTVVLPRAAMEEPPRRRRFSGWLLGFMSVLLVALIGGAIGGWIFLPEATITVAARVEPVGPLQLTVRADPLEVTEDPANGIVPAEVVTFDLGVSQEFPATGKKVSETKATGAVQWTNCDPTRSYTIPDGTIVKTSGGQQFATSDAVFLPVAILSGNPPAIACQSRDVAITARATGTDGNVAAGTITVVPSDYNSVVIRVTNADATSGGSHTETRIVAQKDVDAALTVLSKALRDQFTTQLADPARVPPGLTLFPTTRSMSSGDPTVAPDSLVGQAAPTFTLGMIGTGTATAVDPALVQSIGDQRIRAAVSPARSLVRGSVDVRVGQPHVDGSAVVFPVTARASQVNAPDATEIRKVVKGLPVDEARQRLRDYGDATVDVWPGWVTSITTYDFRLDIRVVSDVATEPTTPEPAPSASSLPSASIAPSGLASPTPSATPSPGVGSPGTGSTSPGSAGPVSSAKASARPRGSASPSPAPSST